MRLIDELDDDWSGGITERSRLLNHIGVLPCARKLWRILRLDHVRRLLSGARSCNNKVKTRVFEERIIKDLRIFAA